MTTDRGLASSPGAPPRTVSAEADFWAELFLDLTVRIEWLGQSLEAVPREDASAASVVRLRAYAQALTELHAALGRVQKHRATPTLKPLFVLDGALAGYLSRLYAWCEQIGIDFERMAAALRRGDPISIVFSHHEVNDSYAQFEVLTDAMRRTLERASEQHGASEPERWREFTERVEELIWATEWVHLTLARRPGS